MKVRSSVRRICERCKIVRRKAFTSHILTKKSTKRKRNLRQAGIVDATNLKGIKRLLPYM